MMKRQGKRIGCIIIMIFIATIANIVNVWGRVDPFSVDQQISELKSYAKEQGWSQEKLQNGINYLQNVKIGTVGSTVGTLKSNLTSETIKVLTAYPGQLSASHNLLGIDAGTFIEAGGGTKDQQGNVHKVRAVDVYIRSMEGNMEVRLQEIPGATDGQKQKAAEFARHQLGKDYDTWGAILGDYFNPDERLYCSELVKLAYEAAGVHLDTASNFTGQTLLAWTIFGPEGALLIDGTNISPQEMVNAKYKGKNLEVTTFKANNSKPKGKDLPKGKITPIGKASPGQNTPKVE
jgi:hypothetical protein